jgi:hypothetical protein
MLCFVGEIVQRKGESHLSIQIFMEIHCWSFEVEPIFL